jgi:DNA-binding LytR/AlgR family response regulator
MKIPLKLGTGRYRLHDADEIFFIESDREGSFVRTARKRRSRSPRRLAAWEKDLRASGFVRIHRSYLVNLNRVREVRHRGDDPNDWEIKLEPPVNLILPVGRQFVASLRKTVGL